MKRLSPPIYYVLVVSKDRWGKVKKVHYLPEGVHLRAGAAHHKPDIVLTDDPAFTNPLLLKRDGDRVYVHLPNQVITVERGGALNLTNIIVEFIPLDSVIPELEELTKLETELFNPNLSEKLRKFLRLYLAYAGLRLEDKVPETVKDAVLLMVSRMIDMPVEKVVSDRKRLLKKIEGEMKEILSSMKPEEVFQVFSLLFS